jgi:predicted nucleotidyltransferase
MASDSLTTSLRSEIVKWAPRASGLREVRLFGSALRVDTPGDLDFIVVYETEIVPAIKASRLRTELKAAVALVTPLPCDVTLFSKDEDSRNRFDCDESVRLWPNPDLPEFGDEPASG